MNCPNCTEDNIREWCENIQRYCSESFCDSCIIKTQCKTIKGIINEYPVDWDYTDVARIIKIIMEI